MSKKERLEQLCITDAEFELYKDLFLKCRKRNTYAELRLDRSWPQFKHCWKGDLILRHLCGVTCVAIPFAYQVNQIVLDIDFKSGRAWAEVADVVKLATLAIPGEPVVYRSSESGGVRMIWFLTGTVNRAGLREWTAGRLRQAGIVVASGKCEVRLGEEPDRLPFGRESMLLDPITLEPRLELDLSTTLSIVKKHRTHFASDPPVVRSGSTAKTGYDHKKLVETCLSSGLPPDVTTNECLMQLAWHFRVREGLEKDEINCRLRSWITKHHNGNSERINNGRIDAVYNQIDRIVDELQASKGTRRAPLIHTDLTKEELTRLLDLPVNFKTASGLFRLLRFSKANFLSRASLKSQGSAPSRGRIGTNKCGKVLPRGGRLTSRARNSKLHIVLSKALLRVLRVPNANNTARFVGEMERLGVLNLKRKAWAAEHKARQFWVNFEFDVEGERLEGDFDRVLWDAIGYDGIRRRFGPYQACRIAERLSNRQGDSE